MSRDEEIRSAFDRGYEARRNGATPRENPYMPSTEEEQYLAWRAGAAEYDMLNDNDNPEWTPEDFARAKLATEYGLLIGRLTVTDKDTDGAYATWKSRGYGDPR